MIRINTIRAARRFTSALAVCLALTLPACRTAQSPAPSAANPTAPAARPNILFIFTDDHASHAIGAYGSQINQTPNLDRLAREGMRFDNCFVTNSICAPSRAVILTGKHSHLNGVVNNVARFDGEQMTFPKLLREAGWQTAMIGKWHLKSEPTGFDHWIVLPGQGKYYNPDFLTSEGRVRIEGYVSDIVTDQALDWLRGGRDADRPFMLMLQHKAPHREWEPGPDHLTLYDDVTIPEPGTLFDDYSGRASAAAKQEMTIKEHLNRKDLKLDPPAGLTESQRAAWDAAYGPKNAAFEAAGLTGDDLVRWKYQRYIKDYLRCIASVDDNVGRVLDYLEESGLAENTVVIYSSDQGFYLGDHGWYDKRWMYEESLRMPLIVRWPGVVRPGSKSADFVQNLDFARTFLDIAGVDQPAEMQGRSIVGPLRGETPADWRKSVYYHYWEFPAVHSVNRHYGVRTERHKLIYYYQLGEWELFDLVADPHELKSVYGDPAYSAVQAELKAELDRLRAEAGDNDPEADWRKVAQAPFLNRAREVSPGLVFKLGDPEENAPPEFDPSIRPLAAGAWCVPEEGGGVIVAHGGGSVGYSVAINDGTPEFSIRDGGALVTLSGGSAEVKPGEPVHIMGLLDADATMGIYINGRRVASREGYLISGNPNEGISVGTDSGSAVGRYEPGTPFHGILRDIRVYEGVPSEADMGACQFGSRLGSHRESQSPLLRASSSASRADSPGMVQN